MMSEDDLRYEILDNCRAVNSARCFLKECGGSPPVWKKIEAIEQAGGEVPAILNAIQSLFHEQNLITENNLYQTTERGTREMGEIERRREIRRIEVERDEAISVARRAFAAIGEITSRAAVTPIEPKGKTRSEGNSAGSGKGQCKNGRPNKNDRVQIVFSLVWPNAWGETQSVASVGALLRQNLRIKRNGSDSPLTRQAIAAILSRSKQRESNEIARSRLRNALQTRGFIA